MSEIELLAILNRGEDSRHQFKENLISRRVGGILQFR